MLLTRDEFKEMLESWRPGISSDGSGVWALEDYMGYQSEWFVCINPIKMDVIDDMWEWIEGEGKLIGKMSCYYSSIEKNEEWWGFTHKEDIPLWMLKWT